MTLAITRTIKVINLSLFLQDFDPIVASSNFR
jgi:hypothetical protein